MRIDDREAARRQHRSIALFAAIQCWVRNLDGVVIQEHHLRRVTNLEYVRQARAQWLIEDFADVFRYREFYVTGPSDSFLSLYVSRTQLLLPGGQMTDQERIAAIPAGGPRLGLFRLWPPDDGANDHLVLNAFARNGKSFDECLLHSFLTLLSQGIMTPVELPLLNGDD
jgi:hypothetical protein